MPRVLIVAHHYPPHVGGLERVVLQQAQSLAKAKYDVVVLTSRFGGRKGTATRGQFEVISVPCWHGLERFFSVVFPLFSPSLICALWRQVKRSDTVHIHDVFYVSSWAAAIVAAMLRRPVLLTQHVALVEHPNQGVMLVQKFVYATIGRWIFSEACKIVVYNTNVRDFLVRAGVPESKLVLLTHGVDTTDFSPSTPDERSEIRSRLGLPQDRKLVLFVGRLVEKKGFKILLDARDPTYELIFAGPGPIPRHGHAQGVRWVGARNQSETRELYRACDLFVFPSIGEVFTLVMQEAMACGLPVVTTNDPAYAGSPISDCIILCRRDPDALRSIIRTLLADQDRLRDLRIRSRQRALQLFDWHTNVSALLNVYTGILGQYSSGSRR